MHVYVFYLFGYIRAKLFTVFVASKIAIEFLFSYEMCAHLLGGAITETSFSDLVI